VKKLIIVCLTIVALSAIGSWVYVQKQNITEQNKALAQSKQLELYQEQQANKRDAADNCTKQQTSDPSNPFAGVLCKP
jgi:uncharacterized protein HemX